MAIIKSFYGICGCDDKSLCAINHFYGAKEKANLFRPLKDDDRIMRCRVRYKGEDSKKILELNQENPKSTPITMHNLLMELFVQGISVYIMPVGDSIAISMHRDFIHVRTTFPADKGKDEVLMMMEISKAHSLFLKFAQDEKGN